MEILVYLFGNWCCIGAASIILFNFLKLRGNVRGSEKDLQISSDLLVMLLIGSLVRVYWSLSPPPIWSEEPVLIQWFSMCDLFFSVATWAACVYCSTPHGTKHLNRFGVAQSSEMEFDGLVGGDEKPAGNLYKYTRWTYLTAGSAVASYLLTHLLPSLHMPGAWIMVDFSVVFNMLLDGVAMVPQVILIHSSRQKTPVQASHFVGLLCLGRLLRMLFWLWLVLHPESGHAIWTFVVPDLLHTVIMADYLYHYLQKLKRDKIDPYFADMVQV